MATLVLVFSLAVGVFGLVQMSSIANRGETIYGQSLLPERDVLTLEGTVTFVRFYSLSAATAATDAARTDYLATRAKYEASVRDLITAYRRHALTTRQRVSIDAFERLWTTYLTYRDQADVLIAQKKTAEWQAFRTEKVTPTTNLFLAELTKLADMSTQAAQQHLAEQRRTVDQSRAIVATVLLVGLLAVLILTVMVSRAIVRPLERVRGVLEAVADGDLTQDARGISASPDLGGMADALHRASDRIRRLIDAVESGSAGLARSSEELQQASSGLVDGVRQTAGQVADVGEAATTVTNRVQSVAGGAEEMESSIREIARNAADAATVAAEAVDVATDTERTMLRLGSSSSEVGDVIKVITTIAEQTNLLALNATIEAARAGETGKGFAVVAGEVKDLAQETAKATDEISRRIEAIQQDSSNAAQAITRMTQVIGRINDYQTTIASAVEQQSVTTGGMSADLTLAASGSEQISRGLSNVAAVADSTSAGAAATSQAAADLRRMSGDLHHLVADFRH